MPKSQLHYEVLHKFIEKLKSEENFDIEMAEKLHKFLTSDDKVTADILASIFCKENIAE